MRRVVTGVSIFLLALAAPAFAQTQRVTPVDAAGAVVGTPANPLIVSVNDGSLNVLDLGAQTQHLLSGVTANTTGDPVGISPGAEILTVNCAGCSGGTTVTWWGTADGVHYFLLDGRKLGDALPVSTLLYANSTTTAGLTYWAINTGGLLAIRADVTNYSAGTVTVDGESAAGTSANSVYVMNGTAGLPLQVTLANTATNANLLAVADATTQSTLSDMNLKMPALGTAGSASSDVLTVQGVTSMTPLKVDGSGVTQPVSGTVTANAGTGTMAVSAASLPLPSGAATSAKQPALGTAGTAASDVITVQGIASMTALKVDGSAVTQPVSISGNQAVNIAQMNGVTTTMGNGASGTGVQRVTIASDSTGQVKVTNFPTTVTLGAGASDASTIRVAADIRDLNGAALASPDANSYQITANAATATSGAAASACNILSTASTNSTNCKASAGNLYGYELYNTTTTVYYMKIFNLSTAPTCSSATGFIRSIPIPPAASAGQVGGVVSNFTVPVNFGTGIGYCITGGSGSTDNTNAATGVFGELRYK